MGWFVIWLVSTTTAAPSAERTEIFRPTTIAAEDLATILNELFGSDLQIATDPRTNTLTATGSPDQIARIADLLSRTPQPRPLPNGQQLAVHHLTHTDAATIAARLRPDIDPAATLHVDTATNGIVAVAHPTALAAIARAIAAHDVPPSPPGSRP